VKERELGGREGEEGARKKSLHRGFGRDMEREGASGGSERAEEGKGGSL
jgi:hypothetical protein